MSQPAVPSPKSRPIWQAALVLSLAGWALTVARLALFAFGNRPNRFDWHSLVMNVSVLILTTALSLRALRRA
jgi:hypothetical protein